MKRTWMLAAAVVVVMVGLGAGVRLGRDAKEAATAAPFREVQATLVSPPLVPPPIDRAGNARVIVSLETREVKGTLADGVEYTFWTFGGTGAGSLRAGARR